MSRDYDRDFAVTYDKHYHWWSVGCLSCGERADMVNFAKAFAFTAKHRKCDMGGD